MGSRLKYAKFLKKLFSTLNEMKSTFALHFFANDLYHYISILLCINIQVKLAGPRRAVGRGNLTRKSEVLGSIPGLSTYFLFSFR